jgi:hypothetical protein
MSNTLSLCKSSYAACELRTKQTLTDEAHHACGASCESNHKHEWARCSSPGGVKLDPVATGVPEREDPSEYLFGPKAEEEQGSASREIVGMLKAEDEREGSTESSDSQHEQIAGTNISHEMARVKASFERSVQAAQEQARYWNEIPSRRSKPLAPLPE